MDGTEISSSGPYPEKTESSNNMESEQFQKFMCELFDKKGVMNDLRAYLRKHIVDLLKSSQKGEIPSCQKHFIQRLELPSQAINILLTEYFLRMEFSYSLSVFITEIPLANMAFNFAKNLMQNNIEDRSTGLRFDDKDVWAILNCLGIKCDSEYACSVLQMYKTEKHAPLLLCIINCMNIYPKDQLSGYTSDSTVALSDKSCSSPRRSPKKSGFLENCHHYSSCKTCQRKVLRLKDKYRNKTKIYAKKQASIASMNGEIMMKNITTMEKEVLDETIDRIRNVHDAELAMVRSEEEHKAKRSLAHHVIQLQQRKMQLEESFSKRAAELERSMAAKKRFLWGLAKALRDQHQRLARGMLTVTNETRRIADKENNLKTKIAEAEEVLRKRGENMRLKISHEMVDLQAHVDSMKRERKELHKERIELEEMKKIYTDSTLIKIHKLEEKIHDGNDKTQGSHEKAHENTDNLELKSSYEMLKTEISKLRKYIEACQPHKSMTERSAVTDRSESSKGMLNNEQEERHVREDVKPPNQVVNDFKKQKNVNFDQLHIKIGADSNQHTRSPTLSEAGDGATIQKTLGHSPGHSRNHSPDNSPGRSSQHSPGRSSHHSPGRGSRCSPGRSSRCSPIHSTGRSPSHSSRRSPGHSSGRSRSPSPRINPLQEFAFINSRRDSVRRKPGIRQIQIKVGDILKDQRKRSPTTNEADDYTVGQSVATNMGHNVVQSPDGNPVQSHLSPHLQSDTTVLKTLEEKEREKERLKARARRFQMKIGEMRREYRSPTSEAGDSSTNSPDGARACSPGKAATVGPGDAAARSRSHSPPTEMLREVHTLKKLLEENERLKFQARQQEEQINSLASQQARLAAQLLSVRPAPLPTGPMGPVGLTAAMRPMTTMEPLGQMRPVDPPRPRTAPAALPGTNMHLFNMNPIASATSMGWRKGAGEELSWFHAPQRIMVPGDVMPFIGVLRDRHETTTKRHILNTYRAVRRGRSPAGARDGARASTKTDARTGGISPPTQTLAYGSGTPPTRHKSPLQRPEPKSTASSSKQKESGRDHNQTTSVSFKEHISVKSSERNKSMNIRDISPKSVLRQAKLKLKNKDDMKVPHIPREKSPTSVLREAKLRLRKLEIEAEAVEKSYLDFRKRHNEKKKEAIVNKDSSDISTKLNKPQQEIDKNNYESDNKHTVYPIRSEIEIKCQNENNNEAVPIKGEFSDVNKEYQIKFDLADTRFKNSNTVSTIIKPIPVSYSNQHTNENRAIPNDNYIEKPITEFRKLYTNDKSRSAERSNSERMDKTSGDSKSPQNSRSPPKKPSYENDEHPESPLPNEVLELQVKKDALMKEKEVKQAELEILKDNINKMYNLDTRDSHSGVPFSETSKESDDRGNYNTDTGKSEISTEGQYESNKLIDLRPVSTDGRDSEATSYVPIDTKGCGERISPNMTILISPKRSPVDLRSVEKRRSVSPEQAARLTRNDVLDAIFHTDGLKETSSIDIEEESKEEQETVTDEEQDPPEDCTDDLSADVDNYNAMSNSEYGNSPISLAKPIDDENFWD